MTGRRGKSINPEYVERRKIELAVCYSPKLPSRRQAGADPKQWDGLLLTLGHVNGKLEFHKSVSMKRSPP